MTANTTDSSAHDDRVDAAVADYLDAKSDESFDEMAFLQQHADVADELKQFIFNQRKFALAADALGQEASSLVEGSIQIPQIGTNLQYFGDYLLLDEIARGGMGVIYRAKQTKLNRIVAVKLILAGRLASKEMVNRFYAEAQAAARLSHPNIVAIHEVGQHEEQHYFSMEYVDGTGLNELIRVQPLSVSKSVEYVKTVAEAIDYAHQEGVLHRDIKPSNILIDHADQPRVTDFGLAKQITDDQSLTTTGQILGTPSYMSPEQADGRRLEVGPASDVYSLGAVLYELLAGRPPFLAATAVETLLQARKQEPISPRLLNDSVSRDLETICLKCLEKDPRKRYATATALADDLERYQTHRPIKARRIGSVERAIRWCRRNPTVAALAMILLFAFVGVTVQWARAQYYFFRSVEARGQLETEKAIAERKALEAKLAQKEAIKQAKQAYDQADIAREAQRREQKNLYIASMNMAMAAAKEGNLHRAADLIEPYNRYTRSRSRSDRNEHRSFDWYYLWKLIHARSERTLPHGKLVRSALVYDQGRKFVTSGMSNQIKKWDIETGLLLSSFKDDDTKIYRCALSPDEKTLFAVGPQGIRVWNFETEELIRRSTFEVKQPRRSAFSPDCRWLALDEGGFSINLIDTQTGETRHRLEGHAGSITALAFSPDSQRLASCAFDHSTRVWDVPSGRMLQTLNVDSPERVYSVAFSNAGQLLAVGTTGADNGVDLWDLETSERIKRIKGHSNYIIAVAFSPDDQLVISGSRDQTIALWDIETGQMTRRITGHNNHVTTVGFLPDSRVFSAGHDGTARIWSVQDKPQSDPNVIHVGRKVIAVDWSRDGSRIACGTYGWGVLVYDATGHKLDELRGHHGAVYGVAFSPDGSLLASASRDQTIRLWNTNTWQEVGILEGHESALLGVAWSNDSKLLASSDTKATVKVWDVRQRKELRSDKFPDENGKHNPIYDVAFSPDDRHVTASGDALFMINVESGQSSVIRRGYTGDAVDYSPDGLWFASTHGSESAFLRRHTGQARRWLQGHANRVRDLVFSPDGKTLITCSRDRSIKIWDVATGHERLSLTGHTGTVNALAITASGTTLASASNDGTIRLWQAADDKEVYALTPAPDTETQIAVSPEALERRRAIATIRNLGGRIITDPRSLGARVLNVYLEGDQVDDTTLARIAPIKELRLLSLRDTRVTGAGLQHLSEWKNLRSLVLLGNHTISKELEHLKLFPQLESVQIGRGLQPVELESGKQLESIDDNAMRHVASLSKLSYVALDNTMVTRQGLNELKRSDTLVRLQIVRTPTIDKEAIDLFRSSSPTTEITLDEPLMPRRSRLQKPNPAETPGLEEGENSVENKAVSNN